MSVPFDEFHFFVVVLFHFDEYSFFLNIPCDECSIRFSWSQTVQDVHVSRLHFMAKVLMEEELCLDFQEAKPTDVSFHVQSDSLIKSWSTWDLARLAPEQANYLDWFF